MILIRTAEALARLVATTDDATLRNLLAVQAENLADFDLEEVAILLVVQPHDTLDDLDAALGWPVVSCDLFTHPAELLERHDHYTVVTFILSDDGFGVVLYIPDEATAPLMAACEREGDR